MSITAQALIDPALRSAGVLGEGQTAPAEMAQEAFGLLNDLLDSWATESLYAYTTAVYTYTLPANKQSVTIGPAGNIVAAVPTRIEGGYIRSGGVDYQFRVVDYAVYQSISQKSIGSNFPTIAYYDGIGTLTFYPVPSGGDLYVPILLRLSQFASLGAAYTLPDGYRRAIRLTLQEELMDFYGRPIQPTLRQAASSARRTLKRANHRVPRLNLPYFHGWENSNVLVTPPDADIYGGGNAGSL